MTGTRLLAAAAVLAAAGCGRDRAAVNLCEPLRHDRFAWNVPPERVPGFCGETRAAPRPAPEPLASYELLREDRFGGIDEAFWSASTHTFPGNDAAFAPENAAAAAGGGVTLTIEDRPVGVRPFAAAELSAKAPLLYGRVEARLKPARVSGVVSAFFLYRLSPWQEIDLEFAGKDTTKALLNVYYNRGRDGEENNYGVSGTPILIPLGFDAAADFHDYAIEWGEGEIRWYADGKLIHRRTAAGPSPVPQLPMRVHFNAWPTATVELGGRLDPKSLPAAAEIRSVKIFRRAKG
ncbi:MAG: family 16 glycosylhydrolase [Elusimicrobia bacterium]|nr:family 16 glycosylhydrolase [Elusimicrobiota bacterium]